MIIVLHLLSDNRDLVIFIGVPNVTFPCFSMAFRKQTGPNICEHINTNRVAIVTMDKY
jgi:hypothetical protein